MKQQRFYAAIGAFVPLTLAVANVALGLVGPDELRWRLSLVALALIGTIIFFATKREDVLLSVCCLILGSGFAAVCYYPIDAHDPDHTFLLLTALMGCSLWGLCWGLIARHAAASKSVGIY